VKHINLFPCILFSSFDQTNRALILFDVPRDDPLLSFQVIHLTFKSLVHDILMLSLLQEKALFGIVGGLHLAGLGLKLDLLLLQLGLALRGKSAQGILQKGVRLNVGLELG
jgi:hypothetical protein